MKETPTFKVEPTAEYYAWIDELESEAYVQTYGTMHDDYGYCPLGIAVEVVHGKGVWQGARNRRTNKKYYAYTNPTSAGYISNTLYTSGLTLLTRERLGIPIELQYEVVTMNDSGHSFKEIATFLRSLIDIKEKDYDC